MNSSKNQEAVSHTGREVVREMLRNADIKESFVTESTRHI